MGNPLTATVVVFFLLCWGFSMALRSTMVFYSYELMTRDTLSYDLAGPNGQDADGVNPARQVIGSPVAWGEITGVTGTAMATSTWQENVARGMPVVTPKEDDDDGTKTSDVEETR